MYKRLDIIQQAPCIYGVPVLPETERKSIATLPNPTLLLIIFLEIESVFANFLVSIVARFQGGAASLLSAGLDIVPIFCGFADGEDGRVVVAMVVFVRVVVVVVATAAVSVVLFCRPDPLIQLYTSGALHLNPRPPANHPEQPGH